jgi:hypothetical protein
MNGSRRCRNLQPRSGCRRTVCSDVSTRRLRHRP